MRATLSWLWPGARSLRRDAPKLKIQHDRRSVLRDGQLIGLTAREFSLLEELVRRGGETSPAKDLFVATWHTDVAATEASEVVAEYVAHLNVKLGRDVVETVPGVGYRLDSSAFELQT